MKDYATLFEFLPIGAYRTLADGSLLRANPALVALNGCQSEAELIEGLRGSEAAWYVDPRRREEFMARLLRDGTVVGFESEVYRFRGRERIWISEHAHVVRDDQGQVRYFEGTVEEITARVQERLALQRSESRLQQLVALVPGVVYRVAMQADGRRRYTFMSEGVRTLYGIDPEEALRDGDALTRRRHPDDVPAIRRISEKAIANDRPLVGETRIRLDDGTEKWVQVLSIAAPPEDGERVRVGLLFDITARKQAEQALRENSELWKQALESTGDGVWDWHVQDGVELLSDRCKALYGFAPHELPDTPDALDGRIHPDDLAAVRQARADHIAGRTAAYVNEHRVQCKDGQWKWVLSRGMVINRDAQGRPLRMIGTHTDVTAVRQAEALRHERDRAAAADVAKSEFLSRVSHELRTPLNAVLGFGQLLEMEPGDGARQRQWVAQVLSGGRHLLALMEDILDLSSAQTGQLRLARDALVVQDVVAEAMGMLAEVAAQAGVTVLDECAASPPLALTADRRRLLQVVSNLLSNAIKYNHRGGQVRVQAQRRDSGVEFSVADTGPGLDALQQSRLFRPFERLDAGRGPIAGTGLGLALCRQFTEAMGGRIEVRSAPGKGSVFSVWLPPA